MAQTTTELILKTIVQGTEAAVSKVKGLTSSINSSSEKAKESSIALAKWGAIAAGAVAAGAVLATKSFISFEDQLANVRKTTGASSDEIKKVGDNLLKYSNTTRSSIDELLTIGTIGGSLGIATRDIESFTKAVDKINIALADEFGGSVEAVTKSVSGLRLIFKDMQSDDIAADLLKIGNALNVAGNVGAATADVVSDFASRIGGVAAPLGFTTGQVLGLSAAMQELQIEPERGSGAFTQIVQKMGQDIKGFAAIAGLSVAQFKKLYNEDINGAFLAVAQGISSAGTSNTKYIETLNKVGLDGIRTSEVIGKLGNNIKLVRERQGQLTAATKETSSVLSEYDVKNNTAAASVAKLKNSVNTLAVNFVGTFAGGLQKAIDGLTEMVQKVPELVDSFKELYESSVLVRSGVILLAGAVLGAFIPALLSLATAAGTALVALAPFMLTGALIAGMVAGILWLYNNWDKVVNGIGKLIIWMTETVSGAFTAIDDTIKSSLEWIKNFVSTKLESIRAFFRNIWEAIKAIPSNVLEAMKKSVKDKLDAVANIFGNSLLSMRQALDDKVVAIKDFFVNLPDRISTWIAQTPGMLYNSGKKMIMEFVNGMTVSFPELNKTANDAAQKLADHLEMHSPAKKGPLSTIDKWMPNGVKTLVDTLKVAGRQLTGPAAFIANSVSSAFNSMDLSPAKRSIQSVGSSMVVASTALARTSDTMFNQIELKLQGFANRVGLLPQELQGPFEQATEQFQSFTDGYREGLKKMEEDFDSSATTISGKIAGINDDLTSLNDNFNANSNDSKKSLAEQFVGQEKKISEIKKTIEAKQKELADNSAALVKAGLEQQDADQTQAIIARGASLDEELFMLQRSLQLEKNALRDARDYEVQISSEISAAKRRDRQSDFTNFIQDWEAKQEKEQAEYNKKKQMLEVEVSDLAVQRDQLLDIYKQSQEAIISTYDHAKDVFLSNLNEQALGTQYYTKLMGAYFDNVSEKIRAIGELPFLKGGNALSGDSIGRELEGILNNRKLNSMLGLDAVGTGVSSSPIASSTPIIASRNVNQQGPAQTINVVIDTFLGQDSFARKALDGFVGKLKQAIKL